MTTDSVRYEIDGSAISSVADFYSEIGRAVNGPGGYSGPTSTRSPIASEAGFGTPEDGEFEFVWRDSAATRDQLSVSASGEQPIFDRIVEVFTDVGVRLELS